MIATLISDFGNGDSAVAMAKGILLSQQSNLQLIDISHEVPSFDLIQCSYLFKSAYKFFPENTVHISLFNVSHSLPAVVLLAKIDNQIIVTADGSFLTYTFPKSRLTIWKYENSESQTYISWLQKVAVLIKNLAAVNFDMKAVKLMAYHTPKELIPVQPSVQSHGIECQILHVDRYGNTILNITKEDFEKHRNNRSFSILVPKNQPLTSISDDYASVVNNTQFCMFNSAGYLEIGVKNASAAQLLGLKAFKENRMIYNTITIEFK